jgi:hypothetical protein
MFEDMNEINDMMGRSYSNPEDIDEVLTVPHPTICLFFPFERYFAFSSLPVTYLFSLNMLL